MAKADTKHQKNDQKQGRKDERKGDDGGDKKERDDKEQKNNKEVQYKPGVSYLYDPCPHRVWTPKPGERDKSEPRGAGSPWYVPVKKKEDVEREVEEKRREKNKKIMEDAKKRRQERREEERRLAEQQREVEERSKRREEMKSKRRQEERQNKMREDERKEVEREEMGCGVRDSRTDLTPELICMMDFITDVDERERERRGEALRWKKEELEEEMESRLEKKAHTSDFRELVKTFVEAEWIAADKALTSLERDERRRRRRLLQNMDPLAKDMLEEAKRTRTLYEAAVGQKGDRSNGTKGRERERKGGPEEDALVSQVMRQMDLLVGRAVA